jgi:pimeloyl-ACP methyl ester carboxylesterase
MGFEYNPNINIHLYHGVNDKDVPTVNIVDWAELINDVGLNVNLNKIRHSSHWNYFYNPINQFLNELAE